MNHHEKIAKKSVESRGLPYYGELKKKYPIHWSSFANMHKRGRLKNIEIDSNFSRTKEGFEKFIKYLGDVPENMEKPTLGRDNHDIGYIKGNFKWESFDDNRKESGIRNIPNSSKNFSKNPALSKTMKTKNILDNLLNNIHIDYLKEAVKYNSRSATYRGVRRYLDKHPNSKIQIDIKGKMIRNI